MAQNIDNVDKGIGWLTKLLELSKKYSILNWIETFTVLFILGVMLAVFTHPKEVVEFFQKEQQEQHTELMEKRQSNAFKIQKECDKLLYSYNAARCMVLELHNSTTAKTGIGFLKASSTFECVNEGIMPVSNQYQNTTLSLLPFADKLSKEKIWMGKAKDIEPIDRSLSYRLRSNGIEYVAASTIRTTDGDTGFLFLTFKEEDPEIDFEMLENELKGASWNIALLLELNN